MIHFKFTHGGWKTFILTAIIPAILFSITNRFFGFGIFTLVAIVISIFISILVSRLTVSSVAFYDTHLVYKKWEISRGFNVDYKDMIKITLAFRDFKALLCYTTSGEVKLPPPAKLETAKEFLEWLRTKNSGMEILLTTQAGTQRLL